MGEGCQWVYRYNGSDEGQEFADDFDGVVPMPKKGDIILRNGKRWLVVMVSTTTVRAPNPPLPVHTVALSDDPNLKIHS
jgi:hypothetical protein